MGTIPTDPLRPIGPDPSTSARPPVVLSPFRVGLDWLTLSMRGPMQLLSYTTPQRWRGSNGQAYVWMPTTQRTAVFDRIFHLQDERGEKLMTVTGGVRSGAMSMTPDWMQVQFSNRTLYTGEFVMLYEQLRMQGFTYLSVSRMDVAADAIAGNGGDYMEPIQRTWGGEYDYYGKAHWRPRFERKRVMGAELGTRASNKFLRVYCKSKELKQAHAMAKAEYIQAAWEASLGESPQDMGVTVNRLEVQVKGKEVRRYFAEEQHKDFPLQLGDNQLLVSMFASMVPKVYDFRTASERARDASPGIVWDFGACSEGFDQRDRAPKTVAMSPHTVKVMIKQLFILAHSTGDQSWRVKAEELAHGSGLYHWMLDALPRWTTYVRQLRAKGGDWTNNLFDQLTL